MTAADIAERVERSEKVRAYMTTLKTNTWKGTRTTLAKQVGGKHAVTMAAIADLLSKDQMAETKDGIRWVTR